MIINLNVIKGNLNIFIIGNDFFEEQPNLTEYIYNMLYNKLNFYPITEVKDFSYYPNQKPDLIFISSYADISVLDKIKEDYSDIICIYNKSKYYDVMDDRYKEFNEKAIEISNYTICTSQFLSSTAKNSIIIEPGADLFYLDRNLEGHNKEGIVCIADTLEDKLDYSFINQTIFDNPDTFFYFYIDQSFSYKINKASNVLFLTKPSNMFEIVNELYKYKYGWLPLIDNETLYYDYNIISLLYLQSKINFFVKGLPKYNDNVCTDFNTLLSMTYDNNIKVKSLNLYLKEIYTFITDIASKNNIVPKTILRCSEQCIEIGQEIK